MGEKKLVNNFLIYILRTLVVSAYALIIFPYASRVLGAEGVGKVQYIQSIATYFQLFATFGITSYGIREGAKVRDDKEKLSQLLRELIAINALMTGVSLVAYVSMFCMENLVDYKALLAVFIPYILFFGLNLDWVFSVIEDYLYITIRTVVVYAVSFILLLLLVRTDKNTLEYGFVIIAPFIGSFWVNLWTIKRRKLLKFRGKLNLKQHIPGVVLLFSIILSSSVYSLLDTTMLGAIKGDVSVGLYTAASKLTRLVFEFIIAMSIVFSPRLSYYVGKKEHAIFKKLAGQTTSLLMLLAIPCAMGLIMFSSQAIEIFSGVEFLDASIAMKILAVNLIFSSFNDVVGWQILVPNNKDMVLFSATCIGAVADVILNLLFIPIWGINGAAVATFLAEIIKFTICITFAKEYISVKQILFNCSRYIMAGVPIVILGLLSKRIQTNAWLTLCIAVPIAAVCYFGILLKCKDECVTEILNHVRNKKQP